MYLLGVLVLAVGVGVSIALHELGHLVPAKLFGVKVTQYMIGFGPTLWSRRRGETEYGIKAIPLGGYCRMIGMLPPRPHDRPGQLRASTTGRISQMTEQARAESMQEIQPGDEDRVFYKLASWKKLVVMCGGIATNLLIAVVLLTGIVTLYGLPKVTAAEIADVVPCVPPASQVVQRPAGADPTKPDCSGLPASPAQQSGLQRGDRLVSVAGEKITTPDDASTAFRSHGGDRIPVVVQRDGRQVTLHMTPAVTERPVLDDQGEPVTGADGQPVMEKVGVVGTLIGAQSTVVRQPVTQAPAVVGSALGQTFSLFFHIPEKMVGVWHAAFDSQQRAADSPMSIVGAGRIAGDATDAAGVGPVAKLVFLISLIASLNIALFVFNLIPLLPMDGGHAAGALWEAVKRAFARVTGRGDPGYVDVAKGLPVAYGVSMVLIVMSVLLIYADLVNPIQLGG
ncbi:MAG TPA: site-2 protease family protein [Segeticoccus sp.]|nr:site-2 protease family protein [Segeticoccus sp.]